MLSRFLNEAEGRGQKSRKRRGLENLCRPSVAWFLPYVEHLLSNLYISFLSYVPQSWQDDHQIERCFDFGFDFDGIQERSREFVEFVDSMKSIETKRKKRHVDEEAGWP